MKLRPLLSTLVMLSLASVNIYRVGGEELPELDEQIYGSLQFDIESAGPPLAVTVPVSSGADRELEIIRERFPDGNVKIERQVTQDEKENYVNHGSWKMFDRQGNSLVEGKYAFNRRDGRWSRWYRKEDVKLFESAPYTQFTGPFLSQVTFRDGVMQDTWTITDAQKRMISKWNFVDGRRDGVSTWWYPDSKKMRELTYRNGELHGEVLEWDAKGTIVTRDRYDEGRRFVKNVDRYQSGNKKSEGTYLHARMSLDEPDNWWECRMATYQRGGKSEKHGSWTVWYSNGQKKQDGQYEYDIPVDSFTWWHPNGQKALQAEYKSGKQNGTWTWWHENGQKSIRGEYVNSTPTGRWIWWKETGKVAQRADFSDSKGRIIAEDGTVTELTPQVLSGQEQFAQQ